MKSILFTSARIEECKLHFDLTSDFSSNGASAQKKSNYRYEGNIEIEFVSSGNFSGMTENEVSELVLTEILKSGLFKK